MAIEVFDISQYEKCSKYNILCYTYYNNELHYSSVIYVNPKITPKCIVQYNPDKHEMYMFINDR